MRVLVISSDWNAFTETAPVAHRFRMQARMVERLDVLVPNGPRELSQIAGNASVRGFGLGKAAGALRSIAAGMRIARPDVVSSQDPFFLGLIAWAIARMRGSRLHLQVHTDLYGPRFTASLKQRIQIMIARFLLRRADSVRVVSGRIADSLRERGIANVAVLPVYTDLAAVAAAALLDPRRYQFSTIILVVARLEPEKQVGEAIEVFRQIHERRPDAGLVIVGGGSERAALEALVRDRGIGNVVFEGAQSPYPFYRSASLMLSTSRFEGYGMAIIEALSAGCPVVAYDVGVAKEAGAIITTKESMASAALATLSEGKRGRLTLTVPTEAEYREQWLANLSSGGGATRPVADSKTEPVHVGYIGQGFIGKNYADELESRGVEVVRYALEEPYVGNKDRIALCDVVFVAVPTPTTPDGYDDSIVRGAIALTRPGATIVIKSTMLPGMTESIQAQYPDRSVFHSPEFLREATAAYDAAHPDRNIIGICADTPDTRRRAETVLRILPAAPFELIVSAKEAEIIKYAANNWLFIKVIYTNLIYDLAQSHGVRYDVIRDGLAADPRIGRSHLDPVHQSGHGGTPGRGAGGHCFIKDFEALRRFYADTVKDERGMRFLNAAAAKNIELLRTSGKDLDLLRGVYGDTDAALARLDETP